MTIIYQDLGYLETDYLVAPYLTELRNGFMGCQMDMFISRDTIGAQTTMTVTDDTPIGCQFEGDIINSSVFIGVEFNQDDLFHSVCGNYLVGSYLIDPYLSGNFICAIPGVQFKMAIVDFETPIGAQTEMAVVDKLVPLGAQALMSIVDSEVPLGAQFDQISFTPIGAQINFSIYNNTNLRIMCEFPSRGVTGTNWIANTTEPGDFEVNNVNTDLVEQVWRSAAGVKTGIILSSDSEVPQGIFVDTFAILNHNLTTSATVTLLGSDNASHAPVGVTIPLTVELDNMYFIADDAPNTGFRYWRILIDDNTNPDDFVSAGTIIFGEALIIASECFTDNVLFDPVQYVDQIFTEGFTNSSNDRGIKNLVRLEFRDINFQGGDFGALKSVFRFAKTTLKCLWIPDPREPSRLAVFGKLREIPSELQKNLGPKADLVTFDVEVDESL